LDSIQDSSLSLPPTPHSTAQSPEASSASERLEHLKHKYNSLGKELTQTKESLETLRLEKDAEIEELKKQLHHLSLQSSNAATLGLETHLDEANYEELQQRRAQERKDLQEERESLRKLVASLSEQGANMEAFKQYFITESVEDVRLKQDEAYFVYHVGVVKEWIEGLLNIEFTKDSLHAELLDGTLLCRAMNKLKPGSIRNFYLNPRVTMLRIENIGLFLNACEAEFGFSPFQLFSASDLIEGQNMKKVLLVLIDIMKRSNMKDYREI